MGVACHRIYKLKPLPAPSYRAKKRKLNSVKQRTGRLLLREPNLYRAFLILALPVFRAHRKAFNELVDTYFIGQIRAPWPRRQGFHLLAPLLNIFASFQVGFGVAGVAVISQLLGARRKDEPGERHGVLVAVAVLLAMMNLLLLCALSTPTRIHGAGGGGDVFVCLCLLPGCMSS